MVDWNSLWINSRFIDKIFLKINQLIFILFKYSNYIIHAMLLLKSSGVPYSNFQLFEFSPQKKKS